LTPWKKVRRGRAKCLSAAAHIVRESLTDTRWCATKWARRGWKADADIAETIDFLEFYGREMLRLATAKAGLPMRGERKLPCVYPLGVGVIIPPWNFPCAIMAGLVAASLVTGKHRGAQAASDSPNDRGEIH